MFMRAMKADPSNVNNMIWYAKFLHKSNQINQVIFLIIIFFRKKTLIIF